MIQILYHHTLIDIIEKIETQTSKDIELSFPVWHPVLHNHLSLKVIKSKAKEKKVIIYTNDKIWKQICKNIWIKLGKNKKEEISQNIMNHNYSIKEYFFYILKEYKKELVSYLKRQKQIHYLQNYNNSHPKNFKIFSIFLISSILLFSLVYYIAISKTRVIITPETRIKTEALNFILDTQSQSSVLGNNNTVKLESVSEKFFTSHSYSATRIKYEEDAISSWKIKVYNYTSEDVALKPNTRFQNSNWIVFTSPSWINIPAGIKDNFNTITPWEIEITILAQTKDISWRIIWSRWNIDSWETLHLPWLPEELQWQIYAKSIENFIWWSDKVSKVVSQEDINRSRELFEEKLKNDAFASLRKKIDISNQENDSNNKIIIWESSLKYTDIIINLENWIFDWTEKEVFDYSGSITISAKIYNTNSIIQKLQSIMNEKIISQNEKIKLIDEKSLRLVEIISTENNGNRMKATFEIEGIVYSDISKENSTFTKNLKNRIKGKHITEAENLLTNLPNIKSAKIINRPFFIKKVSSIMNNIEVEVQL